MKYSLVGIEARRLAYKATFITFEVHSFKKETGVSYMQLIENLFASKGRIKVLKKMARHMGWWFNITELSRDMGTNKGAISKIVGVLEKENLLIVNRKGKIKMFMLNEKNIFVNKFLLPIFKIEEELFRSMKKSIVKSFPEGVVSSILIYGSYAKGIERLESDIDVMAVAKSKSSEEKCRGLSEKISQEFLEMGVLLRVDVIGESELKKLYLQREPAITSLVETGVVLKGKSLEEMIR